MRRILVTVATVAELPDAVQMIKSAQMHMPQISAMVCILDGAEDAPLPASQNGEVYCSAQALFEHSFYHEAFFFSKEEFRTRCGLLLCEKLIVEEADVIWIHPCTILKQCTLPQDTVNKIIGAAQKQPCGKELPLSFGLEQRRTLQADFLYFGAGAQTLSFLQWVNQRLAWVFQKAKPSCMPKEYQDTALALHRDFLRSFVEYAPLFACDILPLDTTQLTLLKTDFTSKYRFDAFTNGVPVFAALRDYYGRNYRLQENCGDMPFDKLALFIEVSFLTGDTHPVPVPPMLAAIYEARGDLRKLFPHYITSQREALVRWFLESGAAEQEICAENLQPLRQRLDAFQAENAARDALYRSFGYRLKQKLQKIIGKTPQPEAVQYPFGINLCGFIKGDFGLGESARILARIFEAGEIPYTVINSQEASGHSYTNLEFAHKISNEFRYNISVFDTNGDGMAVFMQTVAPEVLQNRYNIGYWAWELPEFPTDGWAEAFPMLDEVWTCSDFTSEAIRAKSPVPVRTIPHALTQPMVSAKTRADFNLPQDKFIFLLMYDVRSFSARKNPQAAVEAFLKAFQNNDDVCLLLKLNTPADWDGEDDLLNTLRQSSNVLTYNGAMAKEDLNALIAGCDAFLSLHRSEGFGLGPAEAMALGKPVVLTNWSGNTQYMREGACCAVDYTIVEIDKDYGPYKKGFHWAEPNTDSAAAFMKRLVQDKTYYQSIAKAGKDLIEREFSPQAVSRLVIDRLCELHLMDGKKDFNDNN